MDLQLLLWIPVIAWSLQKVLEKDLLGATHHRDFAKLAVFFNFIIVLPLIFFVEVPSLPSLLITALTALMNIASSFFLYKGFQDDEISRVAPFEQFYLILTVLLAYLFLGERLLPLQYLGIFAAVAGGILISLDRGFLSASQFLKDNRAAGVVLVSAFLSGVSVLFNKTALNWGTTAISLLLFRRLFAAVLIAPFIVKIPKVRSWPKFLLTRILSSYGLLILLFVVSKQMVSTTIPILAFLPLGVAFFSRNLLKEKVGWWRVAGIIAIVGGYALV